LLSDEDADPHEIGGHFDAIAIPSEMELHVSATRERLREARPTIQGNWNRHESRYYDANLETAAKRAALCDWILSAPQERTSYPRERQILRHIRGEVAGKVVLEVGSGTSRTIANLLRPGDHAFRYIGSDISFWNLVVAKQAIPEGDFIQLSAVDPPLVPASVDIGLAFGALHHLPDPNAAIRALVRILKDECFLGFHEPISTPKIISGRFPALVRRLQRYEHSEHDGSIQLDQIRHTLTQEGLSVIGERFSITPFRTCVEHALAALTSARVNQTRVISRTLYCLDQLPVFLFSRWLSLLGPRAVTALYRRGLPIAPA
jgi:ubiquinone/menaquinone biosynthesis C-methylase UbiE